MTKTSEFGIKSDHGEGDIEAVETNDTCLQVRRSARSNLRRMFEPCFSRQRVCSSRPGFRVPPIPASSPACTAATWPPLSLSFPPITLWVQTQLSPLSRSSGRFTWMSHFFRRSLSTTSRAVRRFCIGRRPRDMSWSTCCRARFERRHGKQAWARIVPVKPESRRPSQTISPPKTPALSNRRTNETSSLKSKDH